MCVCTHIQPRNIPLQDCVTREVTRQREGWGESSRALARGGRAWSRTQPLSSLPACTTLQTSVSLRLCSGLSLCETVFRPGPPRDGAQAGASPRRCPGLGLPETVLRPGPLGSTLNALPAQLSASLCSVVTKRHTPAHTPTYPDFQVKTHLRSRQDLAP